MRLERSGDGEYVYGGEKTKEKKGKEKLNTPTCFLSFQMSYSHAQLGFISISSNWQSDNTRVRSQVEEKELKTVLLIAPPYDFVKPTDNFLKAFPCKKYLSKKWSLHNSTHLLRLDTQTNQQLPHDSPILLQSLHPVSTLAHFGLFLFSWKLTFP